MTSMADEKFVIDLTGDGHGHHVPGTPMVYKHGWHPIATGGIKVGDVIRAVPSGTGKNRKTMKVTKMDPPGRTGKFVHGEQVIAKGGKYEHTRKVTMQLTHDHKVEKREVRRPLGDSRYSLTIGGESKPRYSLPIGGEAKGKPHEVPKVHLVEGQGGKTSQTLGKDNPATHRHILHLSDEARAAIYKENGLELTHPDVQEHELLARIKVEKDPKVKAELIADASKRMEVLKLTLAAAARADIDTKREKTRDWASKYDERIRKIKGGRALLSLRDRLLNDKTLDRLGFFKEHGGKVSKDVALRVATATALGLVFGPLGAAAGIAGGAAVHEAVHSLMEHKVSEALADHLMEKHVVERLYGKAVEGAKKGGKIARDARKAKKEVAEDALRAAQKSNNHHHFPEIHAHDLSTPDGRRSPAVSSEEFQRHAKRGAAKYAFLKQGATKPDALNGKSWNAVVDHAYKESRAPWGGTTVDAHTGKVVAEKADAYALTIRNPGTKSVSVSPKASKAEFAKAMERARTQFAPQLAMPGAHLGVFHDEDTGSIDIDPVLVTPRLKDVHDIGAYTHAVGGAYHFKSGNGYWPPHVKESK